MSLLSLQSAFGLAVIVCAAWALSERKRAFSVTQVAVGIALQIAIALLLLKVPATRAALLALNGAVDALTEATRAGTGFVFGYLGGGPAPFEIRNPANAFVIGFQALPLVVVMSALSALLWHWRVLGWVTRGFAFLLQRSMGLGGAVGLASASTMFLGMAEAPLLIRPYLERLTRAELFIMMTVGLASVSGTVLVLYASVLEPVVPGALGQILVASLISLPAGITIARVMVPEETGFAGTGVAGEEPLVDYESSMDAVTRGTVDGLHLLLNILAMLVVMVALVALVNIILGAFPDVAGAPLTLQRMLGWAFSPLVWLMGVPASEMQTAGQLMGTKTILNEFIAYIDLAHLPQGTLSPRSALIMIYGLCGFANLGSVGILIGGLTALVPSRRSDIVTLGTRAIVSGTLATSMTGAVIGLIT
ncbi:nucleoside:proton symporter [Parvibaculum sedimenti]|uniref:Nucleoside:proton symporter n=1 Tax=Parvibaculum sedimenti TaxID=2608632 RepID=A0A6N6VL98_9HYPH|nr:nucleoside transporter C-terminal domain-containing protein [Parvibaculum sedimenti]KAB7741507.1 nucleoside:proton symporter [Parvibaculum sedimenti]